MANGEWHFFFMLPPVIIPAYQPGPELEPLVKKLLEDPGREVIIVDDGSSRPHAAILLALGALPRVHILRHAVNMGKGQALKTAFNYFLVNFKNDSPGVVTADADGQHLPEDIAAVGRALVKNPGSLALGVRSFDSKTPRRSLFGNSLTRLVFHFLSGREIKDTQTGLRGIPREFLPELLRIPATGYEFELEMLLLAVRSRRKITETSIKTVYIGQNEKSHFNPLLDSLRVYFVFLRFSAASLITAALDYAVFSAAYFLSSRIFISIVIARCVAGFFNFTVGKALVFKSRERTAPELSRYIMLVTLLMFVSYGLVTTLVIFSGLSVFAAKLLAEGGLFFASFAAQGLLVFARREDGSPEAAGPKSTDWDSYYGAPSPFASITRRITGRLFLRLIEKFKPAAITGFCELGGANSCFFSSLTAGYPDAFYTVLDTNRKGLDLLAGRCPSPKKVALLENDILASAPAGVSADVVFSAGLIEHFSPKDTAKAIQAHFACARPGGLVIISFPTPTWLYRATRSLAESLGLWLFHDERPLKPAAVEREMARYGTILYRTINWKIILTQGIIVARADKTGELAKTISPGEA